MNKDLTKPAKRVIVKAVEKHGPNLRCVCCYMERHNPGMAEKYTTGQVKEFLEELEAKE
jgi:hypothetical protein